MARKKEVEEWLKITVIRELPFQKEKNDKSRLEKGGLIEMQEDEVNYSKHFEEIILDKIDRGISLTESELFDIVSEYSVKSEYGSKGRWQRSVNSIVKIKERYFSIMWREGLEGLTEYQECSFSNQPKEVFPTKTIEVIEKVEFLYEKKEEYPEEVCKGEDVLSILDKRYISSDSNYSIIENKKNVILKRL